MSIIDTVITTVYPPLQFLKIQSYKGEIIVDPFKKIKKSTDKDPIENEDLQRIIQQNNYSNQILNSIANQLDTISSNNFTPAKQSILNDTSKPLFKSNDILKNNGSEIIWVPLNG